MANNADNNQSPPSSTSAAAETPSPHSQIVPGSESDIIRPMIDGEKIICSPVPENSDNVGNAGGGMNLAWNVKHSNGPSENGGPVSNVMGPAHVWPALSASTKTSPKFSSSNSSKNVSKFGSDSSPQVTGTESPSLSIASPVQSQWQLQSSSTSQKPTTSNMNHNVMSNHERTAQQNPNEPDSQSNPQANGVYSHPSSSPAKGSCSQNQSFPNPGHKKSSSRNASGAHPSQSNSLRKVGGGSNGCGHGSHQNDGGMLGDQYRGHNDWNHSRSFNGKDISTQPRVSSRNVVIIPPLPISPPSLPGPVWPLMGMPDYPMMLNHPPFAAYVPWPVFYHFPISRLYAAICDQIHYYFSYENLIRDLYLRENMDDHGWISLKLIASFRKVRKLTKDIQHVRNALCHSTLIELQGDKLRYYYDWKRWVLPPEIKLQVPYLLRRYYPRKVQSSDVDAAIKDGDTLN